MKKKKNLDKVIHMYTKKMYEQQGTGVLVDEARSNGTNSTIVERKKSE